ncbi:MAG: cell envelope integrity protein TolA [Proteobacteria bacterium]|nr:cell envelope integrity protein TolA [Pseudomonadota bacterium]
MKRQRSRSEKISLGISIAFHTVIILLLVMSFEKTIVVSAPSTEPNKPIIDAVMVSKKTLQEEVKRLEEKETKKRQQEEDRIKAIAQKEKEKEAKQKREKEEALALELKKKEEALKKVAQEKQEKLEKKLAEEKREKEQQAKLKKEQEEKALAEKKKADLEKKVAEEKLQKEKELAEQKAKEAAEQKEREASQQRVNSRVLQNEITRYALLMRNKIHQHWRQPIGFDFDNLSCKVEVKLLPTGEVVDAKVIVSSGSLEFDRSTELAIKKASPLPMPEDSNIAKEFRQFTFTFRPEAA